MAAPDGRTGRKVRTRAPVPGFSGKMLKSSGETGTGWTAALILR